MQVHEFLFFPEEWSWWTSGVSESLSLRAHCAQIRLELVLLNLVVIYFQSDAWHLVALVTAALCQLQSSCEIQAFCSPPILHVEKMWTLRSSDRRRPPPPFNYDPDRRLCWTFLASGRISNAIQKTF